MINVAGIEEMRLVGIVCVGLFEYERHTQHALPEINRGLARGPDKRDMMNLELESSPSQHLRWRTSKKSTQKRGIAPYETSRNSLSASSVLDALFKLDEAELRHERTDGSMSAPMRRLNLSAEMAWLHSSTIHKGTADGGVSLSDPPPQRTGMAGRTARLGWSIATKIPQIRCAARSAKKRDTG